MSKCRGVATLGSSRHVPTHNFHKILRKICIKRNVYIFLVFNVFSGKNQKENSYSVRIIFLNYNAIINAIQTAVIGQFIALKNRKMNLIWSIPNKIVFSCRILQISIIWSFTNINRGFGQWVLFINYYKLWYYIWPIILVSYY